MQDAKARKMTMMDAGALRRRASRVLAPCPSSRVFDPNAEPARGDHDLNPGSDMLALAGDAPRPAAVLVPIIAREAQEGTRDACEGHGRGLTVLFTLRTQHLAAHAGQIAFPGGKVEPGDASPLEAALREAREEVGLAPERVEILGYLDCYQTATGFRIVPVVGLIAPPLALTLDEREVAEVFEVPLAHFLDPRNHRRHAVHWKGALRRYYAMPYGDRYIWGATAGMLRNLYERLVASC